MDNASHRRAWELMAWVSAGSASEAERRFVQEHLEQCAECRAEAAFHERIRAALQQGSPEPHDAEPALRRLLARIDAGAPLEAPQVRVAPGWWRWLVAAVVVQALGLGAAGLALWDRGSADAYRTLSSPAPAARAATLRLVPAPQLDIAGLQALLARHGLVVVEISADARILALAATGAAPDPRALLQRLRSEPGVALAEPIVP